MFGQDKQKKRRGKTIITWLRLKNVFVMFIFSVCIAFVCFYGNKAIAVEKSEKLSGCCICSIDIPFITMMVSSNNKIDNFFFNGKTKVIFKDSTVTIDEIKSGKGIGDVVKELQDLQGKNINLELKKGNNLLIEQIKFVTGKVYIGNFSFDTVTNCKCTSD